LEALIPPDKTLADLRRGRRDKVDCWRSRYLLQIKDSSNHVTATPRLYWLLFMVNFCQPSHEFTFGVGINLIPYSLVLTPLIYQVRSCISCLEFIVYAGL
jgi:hypothetical protein